MVAVLLEVKDSHRKNGAHKVHEDTEEIWSKWFVEIVLKMDVKNLNVKDEWVTVLPPLRHYTVADGNNKLIWNVSLDNLDNFMKSEINKRLYQVDVARFW